ncbi:MAG: phosphate signaling complex protein PhoU [Deltaproteobacteria bacterium]|nr:phosphate signaling complex protein PhoU [Deltaproteobacteria bacterium]
MNRPVDRDLENLRQMALRMGGLSEAILAKAWVAVQERNADLCAEVQHADLEIDRMDVAIDGAVLRVLALQAPVARDLREVIAIKTMATDLERVGDLARNIAKSAQRLSELPPLPLPPLLEKLAEDSRRLLRKSLDAFVECDPDAAQRVVDEDDIVDADEEEVVLRAIGEIREHPELTHQEVDHIFIAKNLERVADHATNIAEDVILVAQAKNLKHAAKLRA